MAHRDTPSTRAEGDVSRGTDLTPPPEAREIFGAQLELTVRYVEQLADAGIHRGLIGPREVPRLWERHVLNCAVLTDLAPRQTSVIDVGSGAGLPGVVMAIRRPDLRVTLVEPLLRRATFLSEVIEDLGLRKVRVVRDRAEKQHGQLLADVVTARAVAHMDKLARWCLPLTRRGGVLLAMKGERAEQELEESTDVLRQRAGDPGEVVECGTQWLEPPTRVIRVHRG